MQIKRFEANNMAAALRKVKQEFGPDAVILSAKSVTNQSGVLGRFKKAGVEITAASDTCHKISITDSPIKKNNMKSYTSGSDEIQFSGSEKKMPRLYGRDKTMSFREKKYPALTFSANNICNENDKKLYELLNKMISQGVADEYASELIEQVKKKIPLNKALAGSELEERIVQHVEKMGFAGGAINIEDECPKIVLFAGPSGMGKTTTIAKLAAYYTVKINKKVALITLDNYRVGAIEQLGIYAKIIGVPLDVASNLSELNRLFENLKGYDLVLVDTAGISLKDKSKLDELKSLISEDYHIETHLVLSTVTKDDDLVDIINIFKAVPIKRLLFTKIDESKTHGNIFNQFVRTKIPVSYFTKGGQVPEDIDTASSKILIDLLLNSGINNNITHEHGQKPVNKKIKDDHYYSEPDEYYVANKNSDIFHHPDCKSVERIKNENIIVFKSVIEAVNKSFKPCRSCISDRDEICNNFFRTGYDKKKISGLR